MRKGLVAAVLTILAASQPGFANHPTPSPNPCKTDGHRSNARSTFDAGVIPTSVWANEDGYVAVASTGGTTPERYVEADASKGSPEVEASVQGGDAPGTTQVAWTEDRHCVVVADERLTPDPITGEEAYGYLRQYVNSFMGVPSWEAFPNGPRTGTPGSDAAHAYVRGKLEQFLGTANVRRQTWTFPIFVPRSVSLTVGDATYGTSANAAELDVYPWYYSGTTPASGVTGPLSYVGLGTPAEIAAVGGVAGKIAVLDGPMIFNAIPASVNRALTALKSGGALGAIVAIQGPADEIVAQNADTTKPSIELPSVVVGKGTGRDLAMKAGESATLVLEAELVDRVAENTIGVIPGHDEEMVVIGTPVNGWFTVSSERGPGVGSFLSAARYFAELARNGQKPQHTLVFAATGGHEIYSLGLERMLACLNLGKVVAYVHYGAGSAGKDYVDVNGSVYRTGLQDDTRAVYVSENPYLYPIAHKAFFTKTDVPNFSLPPKAFNPGEQSSAYNSGVPIVAMSGASVWHHTPGDTLDRTNAEIIDPIARAYQETIAELSVADGPLMRAANAAAAANVPGAPAVPCPDQP